jgi:hypothetical protein
MRCRYCTEPAGWWRRRCRDCCQLEELFGTHRGADMGTMMDVFMASGVPRPKVEKFFDADLNGAGTVRDQIAADMTNQLLGALGQRGRQTAGDVKRIRERGGWTRLDQRPRE